MRLVTSGAESVSPYLVREARLIALARALRDLLPSTLHEAEGRAAAYAAAGLAPVTTGDDEEALRRQLIYWRRIRPQPALPVLPASSAPAAGLEAIA